MKHTSFYLLAVVLGVGLFILISAAAALNDNDKQTLGSVSVSSEYTSTSTAASSIYGANVSDDKLLKTGGGTLGSVVITGATAGIFHFYNATTTNVNLRTGNKATTTITLASFPASIAAGTYTFDIVFTDGLLLELSSGTIPTGTITWR